MKRWIEVIGDVIVIVLIIILMMIWLIIMSELIFIKKFKEISIILQKSKTLDFFITNRYNKNNNERIFANLK